MRVYVTTVFVKNVYPDDREQAHVGAMVVLDTYPTKETILAAMDGDPTISTIDQYKLFRTLVSAGLDAYGVPQFLAGFGKQQQTAAACAWHFDGNEANLERPPFSVINGKLGEIRVQMKTLFEGKSPKTKVGKDGPPKSKNHLQDDEDE